MSYCNQQRRNLAYNTGAGNKIDRACVMLPVTRRFFTFLFLHHPNYRLKNFHFLFAPLQLSNQTNYSWEGKILEGNLPSPGAPY